MLALAGLLAACGSLPRDVPRPQSHAVVPAPGSTLSRAVEGLRPPAGAAPGTSGVQLLVEGSDAFAARMALIRAAEQSLDIQTYIWADDDTGHLLLHALLEAADRGVRVRILLDDNNTARLDDLLALAVSHPRVEVRLFNPFPTRALRLSDWLGDFDRLNRRMHNKVFLADNLAAIVGGRNVGDRYFAADTGLRFEDADLLVVGPVVPQVSASFDRYWNHPSAWPARAVIAPDARMERQTLSADVARRRQSPRMVAYREALMASDLVAAMAAGRLPVDWALVELLDDEPEKILHPPADTRSHMSPQLLELLGSAQQSLDVVSAYFVPGDAGTAALVALARRGVAVRVLTNSLAATDVAAAHVGYARHRLELLRAGVRLFELRPAYSEGLRRRRPQITGSHASLHAKAFTIDGKMLFVGSFNFDPRSTRLNTEVGLLVRNDRLAQRVHEGLRDALPQMAWEVRLDDGGALQWVDADGDVEWVEPEASPLRRLLVRLLALFDLDWML